MSEARAVIMAPEDNVATLVTVADPRQSVTVVTYEGGRLAVVARQGMPLAHKLAVQTIEKGRAVVKYGEVIGEATERIEPGDHVHVHNMYGIRGRR